MEVLQHLLLLLQLVVLLLQPVQLLQGDHGLRNIGCCLLGVIVGDLLNKNRGVRLVWGFLPAVLERFVARQKSPSLSARLGGPT